MIERFEEIEHAIQNIERNLLLMQTNAGPELVLATDQALKYIEEFRRYEVNNIKRVADS